MADELRIHSNRLRAESFGSVAENYDRYRPGYPSQLIDDLVALAPRAVLDIGCGTGKAAVPLVERGVSVLGVELDERMAEVARGHGIEVEVGAFETWDDAGRTFDLIISGQAWHWIDPVIAVPKVARLLRPAGTVFLIWNADVMREPLTKQIDAVYRKHVPEMMASLDHIKHAAGAKPYVGPFEASGLFAEVDVVNYTSERTDTTDQWIGLVRTHSDHVTLDPERREALLAEATAVIDEAGGLVPNDVTTYVIRARTAGPR
jgi:SAM-dependent methyltransferase